ILFFSSYFAAPYEGEQLNEYFHSLANADSSTLKSNLREYAEKIVNRQTRKIQTLNNESLRSMEEVRIANFLYMNQIEYEYEPMYQHSIYYSNKPYTPDFRIKQGDKITYIEHFGITESGQNTRYDERTLERYKNGINDKIKLHRAHNTNLIYTFSKYNDGRDFIEHLHDQLIKAGYVLKPRSQEEVYKKLVDNEEGKYITPLTLLICTFIDNFKTQGYKYDKFEEFIIETRNVRTKLFLEICRTCYLEYQRVLVEKHGIDFQDMINESAELIRKRKFPNGKPDFEYIIVDEYQDISRQRYNLIKELSEMCQAKIVAVGDDWQSIYAFSGSVLPLFTQFCDVLGYAQELKITRTYRNAQEVIDIAGRFIQQNPAQIRKDLISPKRISNPVVIYAYSEETQQKQKSNIDYCLALAVNDAIKGVLEYNDVGGGMRPVSILLIGRYGFDARNLSFSGEFNYNEKTGVVYSRKYGRRVRLSFMTAHSSKGLSADNVIIINAKDTLYGFPSKVDDDPVLRLVVSNDSAYNYAEERRLFYVALTRTRNRVFIVTPEKRPSEFIKELLANPEKYPNVRLNGELKTDLTISRAIKNRCPICGYPLQYRWKKNYGLKLFICTNDQEVCGFMTNDTRGGDFSIHKCDWCKDGYLVVKRGPSEYILGCTNYNPDKSGCRRMLSHEYYQSWKETDHFRPDREYGLQ
ncbi:MAG: UvrD-helicase domain-containing protein, partial [Bacteroidales bacterium]|nr:UvrD-helicase domain-containing protein [Bacteroidales bacterium]